jgi:hypothetical protein
MSFGKNDLERIALDTSAIFWHLPVFMGGAGPSKIHRAWAIPGSTIPSIVAAATIVASITSEIIGRHGSLAVRNEAFVRPVGPPESQTDLSLFILRSVRQLSI